MQEAAHRADPPAAHMGAQAYATAGDLVIMPEAKVDPRAQRPEDHISKDFNPHLIGAAAHFVDARAADIVADLIGPDVDVFQSQFILKNAGAWGQPWRQDSYYFPFDHQPQVGVWLAISEATLENGCLSVLPGSHRGPIHDHLPDLRPGANQGYLEVLDQDVSAAVPMTMAPGDLLVFHSYLLHRSIDYRSTARRSAMAYHYGRAGTLPLRPLTGAQRQIHRWIPVRRQPVSVS